MNANTREAVPQGEDTAAIAVHSSPFAVKEFFAPRPASRPMIYAYEDTNPQFAGLLKVGYTTVDPQTRVAQQYPR